ncbi:hypothetical protein LOZ66_006697 [Ophidiomyces ophidiicola]|nr:hypothetical protein LOZ66_006697 [Ophidiomyces ophidiicola]
MTSSSINCCIAHLKHLANSGSKFFLPCDHCAHLNFTCIHLSNSSKCHGCMKAGNCACVEMSKPSAKNWDHLLDAHDKIEKEEESVESEFACLQQHVLDENKHLSAKATRLQKQKKLLQKCAWEFLSKDIQTVKELEWLEEEEKQRVAEQASIDNLLATLNNSPSSESVSDLFSLFLNAVLVDSGGHTHQPSSSHF